MGILDEEAGEIAVVDKDAVERVVAERDIVERDVRRGRPVEIYPVLGISHDRGVLQHEAGGERGVRRGKIC